MKGAIRKFAIPIALAALMFASSGCKKKKPAVPAPQAEAPTIEAPQPAAPPAVETPAPEPPPAEATATPAAPAPKPKKARPRVAKKPSAGVPAASNGSATSSPPPATIATNGSAPPPPPPNITTSSGKVIVPEGSVGEPTNTISTSMPTAKENETRSNTEKSLLATERDLKAITWVPSLDQKTMMDQIKTYIVQSRTANTEGDVLRASNLAQKARLLCDELLKK